MAPLSRFHDGLWRRLPRVIPFCHLSGPWKWVLEQMGGGAGHAAVRGRCLSLSWGFG